MNALGVFVKFWRSLEDPISKVDKLDDIISISSCESDNKKRLKVSKNDKITAAMDLPTVASYNMRSLFPKIENVKTDILERGITVGFFSEIWEKLENKNHKFEIENMMESEGLKYISTPWPRGWGGAAIIANQEKFILDKLDVVIPHNLEVVWGLLRSKSKDTKFRKILLCSFYSPPRTMRVRYKGKISDYYPLPGGGPQHKVPCLVSSFF